MLKLGEQDKIDLSFIRGSGCALHGWIYQNYGMVNKFNGKINILRSHTLKRTLNRVPKLINLIAGGIKELSNYKIITNCLPGDGSFVIEFDKFLFCFSFYTSYEVYFKSEDNKYVVDIFNKFDRFMERRHTSKLNGLSLINLIVETPQGLDIIEKTLSFDPSKIDIKLQYNDSFRDSLYGEEGMLSWLKTHNKSGLHLLHSKPGCGKTTFIKWLMAQNLEGKKVFYISPEMTKVLTSPSFINFITNAASNSILVIEDAEGVIASRSGGSSDAVSNLLNMTDGILGDLINTQIICTFNTKKEDIDEALLRPGRLLSDIELDELCADKSDAILEGLGKPKQGKPMRICDIYNTDFAEVKETKKIGFGN